MRKEIILCTSLLLALNVYSAELRGAEGAKKLSGTITLSGAWALYPMAVKWGEEFRNLHPEVKIDISAGGAGKGMTDALSDMVDIGMVSREIYPAEVAKGAWWVSVVKDAVVPTVNAENPFLAKLLKRGVTREEFINIFITGQVKQWQQLLGSEAKAEIHVYTRSDACGAAETWAKYLGKNQENIKGVGVYGDPGLAEAVRKDLLGIGYNNINFAYDAKSDLPIRGLQILPLDINGDGKIGKDENFYQTRKEVMAAIAADKYPSPPARALHFVGHGVPKKELVVEFIKWVLTDGQKQVPATGYIALSEAKLQEALGKLKGQ